MDSLTKARRISIACVVLALLVFLIASKRIYDYKRTKTYLYKSRVVRLNIYETPFLKLMEKTGEVETKAWETFRPKDPKGGYNIFDDVSRSHKKRK